jgi:CubicO group peptidase (beta-lactamase class C family)
MPYHVRVAALALVLTSLAVGDDKPTNAGREDAPAKKDAEYDGVAAFPRGEAAELSIDKGGLDQLRERAKEADSDAVVIVKDGRLVADWDFGRDRGPIEAMSATKSIVNLAIGRLIDQGKIKSLDQPVRDFYPEWNQGRKKLITVRHLLNHTSGLQDFPITTEIYASPNFVQFALAADMSNDPGSKFFYNNKAVNLLAGVVQRASGERMDVFIGKEIFAPLGITDFGWTLDRAGNPHGMAGLQIRAIDLAKIGQMMLDEGVWKGRQVVSKEWVRQSVEPGQTLDPTCGLLWWRVVGVMRFAVDEAVVKHFKDHGMTARSVEKLEALKGKPMEREAFWATLRPIVLADDVLKTKLRELNNDLPRVKPVIEGPVRGYAARGYLGQYLYVMPRHRLVAVRQRRSREGSKPGDLTADFLDFMEMVAALVPDQSGR